jgi:deoxyribodipyrimidine photo-lyase
MQHRLIWFRDDLRVTDNAAVSAALDCDPNTRISAVFLTAESDWASFGYGPNRLYYTQQLLTALSTSLASLGICLTVIRLKTYHDQVAWIGQFCATECVSDLYFNQEYQWNERLRDRQIRDHSGSVTVHAFVDRVLLQPSTVLTGDERFYSVFSPVQEALVIHLPRSRCEAICFTSSISGSGGAKSMVKSL